MDVIARRPDALALESQVYIIECKASPPYHNWADKAVCQKRLSIYAAEKILITDAQLTPAALRTASALSVRVFNLKQLAPV